MEQEARAKSDNVSHEIVIGYVDLKNAAPSPGAYYGEVPDPHPDHHEFCRIKFQKGPLAEVGRNGIFIEDLLPALIEYVRGLNAAVPSRETALAITKLQEALMWFNERTRLRRAQGVEGSYKVHQS